MSSASFESIVTEDFETLRLDVYLAECVEDASRSFLQKLIKDGHVRVNGRVCTRPSRKVAVGERVELELPPPPKTELHAENIPVEILYQDEHVVVVNKPSGLVVHPAPGHYTGTLVNALLFHCSDFQEAERDPLRPGIVHRLDQYTSGVMVVAKSPTAFAKLSRQAREHRFDRRYLALVAGEFKEDAGRIIAPMGRSLADRTRMSVTGVDSREALTNFEVLERFGVASLLSATLETGRTHQIRVHLRFAGHPVLGDPVYGLTDYTGWPVSQAVKSALNQLQGQALHAERLGFVHPATEEQLTFHAPPPNDFQAVLEVLRKEIEPRRVSK